MDPVVVETRYEAEELTGPATLKVLEGRAEPQ